MVEVIPSLLRQVGKNFFKISGRYTELGRCPGSRDPLRPSHEFFLDGGSLTPSNQLSDCGCDKLINGCVSLAGSVFFKTVFCGERWISNRRTKRRVQGCDSQFALGTWL
jgi:hypothetical protein